MELLLNKYFPKSIDDFNISNDTKNLLKILIKSNNLNLIITGNIGSGKSSLVDVIINNYYDKDDINNLLYINLLKDQGLNYYKNELKNFCDALISNMKKKTIIIEDLEIFNEQTQILFYNIINKYKNINFIITTNSINKIHNNILELLEIIQINNIDYNFLHKISSKILLEENIDLGELEINYLINISNNYISNLINYLQKCILLDKKLNIQDIKNLESNIILNSFSEYIELCKKKKIKEASLFLLNIINKGFSVIDILENITIYFKFFNTTLNQEEIFNIIKIILKYINIFYTIHEDNIEIYFLTNNIINIIDNSN